MNEAGNSRWLLWGTALAYLLIGLEVLIMITPFALYFYGVYGPLFELLAASPVTAWSSEFFLPHLVFVADPLLVGLAWLQLLFPLGLLLFLVAAVPLYWGRFTGKGVVTGGFYAWCRHPQYLFLALSGFGLLLYWPRFIILILYVVMLFVYYLLARLEERRMAHEAPEGYRAYMTRTAMFFPREPGGRLFRLFFGRLPSHATGLMLLFLLVLGTALAAAFALRALTLQALPQAQSEGVRLISVYPRPAAELQALMHSALADAGVRSRISAATPLVYVMPGDYFLTGLLLEEGPTYSAEKLRRFPELLNWRQHRFQGGLKTFFGLFYHYVATLGTFRTVYDVERLVLVQVKDVSGHPVPAEDALALGVRRTPALVVDLDAETKEVLAVVEVSGNHLWGRLPMPAF